MGPSARDGASSNPRRQPDCHRFESPLGLPQWKWISSVVGPMANPENPATAARPSSNVGWRDLLPWIPAGLILAWWVRDLSHQWSSLVDYHYGWILLMLTGFLVWERWPTRPMQDRPVRGVWPLLLGLAGLPLVVMAELYRIGVARSPSSSMALSLGCTLFLCANLLLLRGPQTLRHFAFPLLFFYLAVPLPKIIWNPVVFSLQSLVTTLNVETLNLMGIPAERRAHLIQLPNCVVGVDEACSGIRSLQSSLMAALFVGDLTLRRGGGKALFLVAGIGLAMLGNFLRSLYLSLTAYREGPEALKAVHDSAGWSVLVFTAGGVILLAWALTRLEQQGSRSANAERVA